MANDPAEIFLEYGADFIIDDTGDLQLAVDSLNTFDATIQRLTRLLLTSPVIYDNANKPLTPPDDIFHPEYGAGLRAAVDSGYTKQNLTALKASILSQLAEDPAVANTPQPQVAMTLMSDNQTVLLNITFTTVQGQTLSLPTLYVSPQGS